MTKTIVQQISLHRSRTFPGPPMGLPEAPGNARSTGEKMLCGAVAQCIAAPNTAASNKGSVHTD